MDMRVPENDLGQTQGHSNAELEKNTISSLKLTPRDSK